MGTLEMVDATVLFEYTAEQEDELSLAVGDVVKSIDCQNGGWWEGEVDGKRGMFPENFVEIIKGNGAGGGEQETQVQEKSKAAKKAKVTFDYEAEQPDELTLCIGDIVEITLQEDEGWWEGNLNGKSGAFPSNFVEVIEFQENSGSSGVAAKRPSVPPVEQAGPTPIAPSHHTEEKPEAPEPEKEPEKPKKPGVGFGGLFSAADLQKKLRPVSMMDEPAKKSAAPKVPHSKGPAPPPAVSHGKKHSSSDAPKTKRAAPALPPEPAHLPTASTPHQEKAKAVFAYLPENEDELELNVGDIVIITDKGVCDGWWEGELKGKKGVFPNNFVELLLPEEPIKPSAAPPTPAKVPLASSPVLAGPRRPLLPLPSKSSDSKHGPVPHEPTVSRPPPPEVKRAEHKKPSPPLPGTKPPKPKVPGKSTKAPPEKPPAPAPTPAPTPTPAPIHVPTPAREDPPKELQPRSMSFGVRSGPPQPPKPSGFKKTPLNQSSVEEGLPERSASVSGAIVTNGSRRISGDVDFDLLSSGDTLQNINKSRVKGPGKNLPTKKTLPRSTSSEDKTDGKPTWMNEVQTNKEKARSPSSSSQDGRPSITEEATPTIDIDTKTLDAFRKEINGLNDKMTTMEKKLSKQIKTLTDDLDSERKERLNQQVEIDRLRKQLDLLDR